MTHARQFLRRGVIVIEGFKTRKSTLVAGRAIRQGLVPCDWLLASSILYFQEPADAASRVDCTYTLEDEGGIVPET